MSPKEKEVGNVKKEAAPKWMKKLTIDSDMICGQRGDQVDQDGDQTSVVRFEEINQKLDKLLALCALIEDLRPR